MTRLRPLLSRFSLPRQVSRFRSSNDGATAVEFGLVALPFFGLLLAIMQTSLVLFTNQTLQSMTTAAGRTIMTGEATTLANFKTRLCGPSNSASFIFDCNKVRIQVKSFPNFGSADPKTFFSDACFNYDPDEEAPAQCWDPGTARSVVLVRIVYELPYSVNLKDLDKKSVLVAVSAFRNEPY